MGAFHWNRSVCLTVTYSQQVDLWAPARDEAASHTRGLSHGAGWLYLSPDICRAVISAALCALAVLGSLMMEQTVELSALSFTSGDSDSVDCSFVLS